MNQDQFWILLAKKQSGDATPEEQTELNEYLLDSDIDKDLIKQVGFFWDTPILSKNSPTQEEIQLKWNNLHKKIKETQEKNDKIAADSEISNWWKQNYYKLAIAASFILMVVAGVWWMNAKNNVSDQNKNIVSTKNGSKSRIQLPDGTVVWLNAGSKILYNAAYNKTSREIQLTGEAFFEVVHDASRPFIIHTRVMNIKVLGTIFNVKAYPNDKVTETSLIKGSIEVSFPGRNTKNIILKPNEKITVVNDGKNLNAKVNVDNDFTDGNDEFNPADTEGDAPEVTVSNLTYQTADSAIAETAWALKSELIFRSRSFKDLSKDMERWFNVTIQFADKNISEVKFTGLFSTETITEALAELQLSYHFKYKMDKYNNLITIYNK